MVPMEEELQGGKDLSIHNSFSLLIAGVGVEQMFSFSLSSSSSISGGDCDSLLLDHSTLSAEEPVSSSDSSNDSGDEGNGI